MLQHLLFRTPPPSIDITMRFGTKLSSFYLGFCTRALALATYPCVFMKPYIFAPPIPGTPTYIRGKSNNILYLIFNCF